MKNKNCEAPRKILQYLKCNGHSNLHLEPADLRFLTASCDLSTSAFRTGAACRLLVFMESTGGGSLSDMTSSLCSGQYDEMYQYAVLG